MYEKNIFQFNKPMTNIACYGYSIYCDTFIIKTVYYDGTNVMTGEDANIAADNELKILNNLENDI